MKFQLVIEPDGQRLLLIPENTGEQQILASIAGEPPVMDRPAPSRSALVGAEWSGDRTPYKKLVKLRITFGSPAVSDE